MASEDLSSHIAWLDAEATEQEALAKALAPYSAPDGSTTIGEIVRSLRATDSSRAEWLLGWARSLVVRGSSLASGASYRIEFDHNEVDKRLPGLKRATWLPLFKLRASTQAFVAGCHSVDEEPGLADLRAESVAAYLRLSLPASRTIGVKPHVCTEACRRAGERVHAMRQVEINIFTRAEFLAVGQIQHGAESTRNAHRSYVDVAAGRPGLCAPRPPSPEQKASDEDWANHVAAQIAPARALWQTLAPYHDEFKYDSIGTLVACMEKNEPAAAGRIIETLQAMIDDPDTPHVLANLTGQTIQFVPQRVELCDGQEAEIADLLSEMNQRDGGTCVVVRGWHETNDEPALADRRGEHLLSQLRRLANRNVQFKLRPHVCGPHCTQERIPVLRRIGWVDIRWQPRNVMLENIRIAANGIC